MRAIALITTVIAVIMSTTSMQAEPRRFSPEEQTLVDLSNRKWQWMADKNVTELAKLFHREATFVHMGGTWGKERELAVIADGFIWYKHTEIHTQEAKLADGVGFVYSDIQMTSEVGGREVSFPLHGVGGLRPQRRSVAAGGADLHPYGGQETGAKRVNAKIPGHISAIGFVGEKNRLPLQRSFLRIAVMAACNQLSEKGKHSRRRPAIGFNSPPPTSVLQPPPFV